MPANAAFTVGRNQGQTGTTARLRHRPRSRQPVVCLAQSKNDSKDPGMDLKAAWYGAEIFGKLVGGKNKPKAAAASVEPITWDTALKEVRADFDNNYFVSGDADMVAYDPDCEFADPFVSFNGVDRFKTNLSNFSSVTSDVKVDITDWEELEDLKLKVSWRFRCILELPWKPVLAAAGSTTYVGDAETGLIVKHIEAWDANPREVVTRLLRPSRNPPETAVEKFMAAAARGQPGAAWMAAAGPLLVVVLPDAVLTSAGYYFWNEGGVGAFLFWLQVVLWTLTAACAGTEAYRRITDGRAGPP
eukprot:jgi/Ulvmu1/2185/UM013_0031.1